MSSYQYPCTESQCKQLFTLKAVLTVWCSGRNYCHSLNTVRPARTHQALDNWHREDQTSPNLAHQ